MKILTFLLFCFVSVISYAQKSQPQIFPHTAPSLTPQAENWLDTTNMYNSRYGPVARLTQDNMPCIMPYAPVNAIPNAAPKEQCPVKFPTYGKIRLKRS